MLKHLDGNLLPDLDPEELAEWTESLDDALVRHGPAWVQNLLVALQERAYRQGVTMPFTANTPYINTIPVDQQPRYPGNREIERRIKSIIRWNAMAMVVRANRDHAGIGGHISTYASAATLIEVGFNHFFRGKDHPGGGDAIYFQGHASPGIYARAFLEGRLAEENLEHFRNELSTEVRGLSSYPHPWLMPDFWEFPTVSMGLGPLTAIYHARFDRYLADRGLVDTSDRHVWCFVGDGEVDEPETLGAINLASRERLDNLIFVINCNLQRLDGPVRGNGKIIQELEAGFRGAGWNVLKVIWGSDWDPILAEDRDGLLVKRMGEVVDGQYQKYVVESGAYIREHFFGKSDELLELVEQLTDDQLQRMKRGGHDPEKVYAAYKAAVEHKGAPTVILAKTIKGYGLGEAGEGRNVTHQQKKLNEDELREFRTRFAIPVPDEELLDTPFYMPPQDSPEITYLKERRASLGGPVPAQSAHNAPALQVPPLEDFSEFLKDSGDRDVSTTMAYVRLFSWMLREPTIGRFIVPIIPDEAHTFGMEALFRQCGIYSSLGQNYVPVDAKMMLYYKEAKDGQILEEGINEAGAISSFIAAGTAYANHGINMIPFYIYYSMFGFQRIGDFIWAAADSRCKGFLLGGTAERTTLAGEGLQHQDGHTPLMAATVPNLLVYDPAYAYETTVIIQDGLRRMYQEQEAIFYYLTLYNENYLMPAMPEGSADGILRGVYPVRERNADPEKGTVRPQLLGSGTILREVLRAQDLIAEKFGISSDAWSVTSYKELRRDALEVERENLLNPGEPSKQNYIQKTFEGRNGPYIAASDYMRLVPEQIARWLPGRLTPLGTDGFGRSDTRENLRRHFEVDAEHIAYATICALARDGVLSESKVSAAARLWKIDPKKLNPLTA